MIKRADLYACLTIIILAASLYGKILTFDFIGDDWPVIAQRESFLSDSKNIRTLFLLPGSIEGSFNKYSYSSGEMSYRPLKTLSFFLDYKIWGLNPFGFKLSNLLFHILNTLLIYRLCLFFFSRRAVSLITALAFLLHPVNVETVAMVTYRHDLMALFFYLAAFFVFISVFKAGGKSFFIKSVLCCIFYILAVLSKESALTFLPLALFYLYISLKDKARCLSSKKSIFLIMGLVFITIVFGFLRFYCNLPAAVNHKVLEAGIYSEFLTVIKTLALYVKWLIVPLGIKFYLIEQFEPVKSFNIDVFLSFVIVIPLLAIALRAIFKNSFTLKFACGWILINLMPLCLIRFLPSLIAARYMYMMSVGFVILLGALLTHMLSSSGRYKIASILIAAVLGFYFIKSSSDIKYWQNNLMLWSKMKRDFPANDYIQIQYHINYGGVLLWRGDANKALEQYLKAYFINPIDTAALQGVADSFAALGNKREADKFYDKIRMLDK